MNLDVIKKEKITLEVFWRYFLALVFLSAGIFRIFNPSVAAQEFVNLELPLFLSPLMIIFEISAGLGLLLNKYTKQIYCSLLVFLVIVLGWALIINGREIINQASELFIFNLTPTDWFLHLVFLIIVVSLFKRGR
jgi:uncharacterized membrane protein YphA (DoxX/SURF4 family)